MQKYVKKIWVTDVLRIYILILNNEDSYAHFIHPAAPLFCLPFLLPNKTNLSSGNHANFLCPVIFTDAILHHLQGDNCRQESINPERQTRLTLTRLFTDI